MATLQRQARALGDPTRHRIFQFIAAEPEAVDVARLTAHFSLNHNAIRQHLAKLLEAGLIEEDKAGRTSPGRPRLVYRVAPTVDSKWGAVGPYERLSLLLAEVIRTGKTPKDVGRDLGRRLRAAPRTYAAGLSGLADAMRRHGFEPRVDPHKSGSDMVLQTCPFASTALADRVTVCSLHLGLAEGLVEDTGAEVEKLVARDPRHAQCLLRLRPSAEGFNAPARLVLIGGTRTKAKA